MISTPRFAALLGLAAVVIWATEGFGWALLALLTAALFGLTTALLTGSMSASELRERLDGARAGFADGARR
jgi:hypothetical protein